MSNLSIKHRVWIGLGILLVILCIVSLSALFNLSKTGKSVKTVSQELQPVMMAASDLDYLLEKINASLGFYLLSKDAKQKENLVANLKRFEKSVAALQEMPLMQKNQAIKDQVLTFKLLLAEYQISKNKIIEHSEDDVKNFPSRFFAAQNINPISQQMLQQVSGMIMSESEEEVSRSRRDLLLDMEALRYNWSNVMNSIRAFLSFRNESSQANIQTYLDTTKNILDRLKAREDELGLDQLDALEIFADNWANFDKNLKTLYEIHLGPKWRMDSYLISSDLLPLLQEIEKSLSVIVETLESDIQATSNSLISSIDQTGKLVIGLLFVGILLSLGVSLLIGQWVIAPIQQAMLAMHDIAEGEGDLTQRLDDSGQHELAQLASGFNKFTAKVQGMVHHASDVVTQLASSSAQLSAITEETQNGTDRQRNETDQVATAVTQMASTVQEVARSTDRAAEKAHEADAAARNGKIVVGQTIESIDNLASEVEKAASVINQLEQESANIGGVLDVIRGIAEQTNLLALNAAIEAARAGEQGRGFAVVADEVRTLASRTQQSTAEIQDMIERLQNGAGDAVKVMEQSRVKAKDSLEQAAGAGTSLESITAAVTEINDMNTQIASAEEEQSCVAEVIHQNVVSITEIADKTAAGAHQTASATAELNRLSEQLRAVVGHFKA